MSSRSTSYPPGVFTVAGKALRRARLRHRLTQDMLADKLGISQWRVGYLEAHGATMDVLEKVMNLCPHPALQDVINRIKAVDALREEHISRLRNYQGNMSELTRRAGIPICAPWAAMSRGILSWENLVKLTKVSF